MILYKGILAAKHIFNILIFLVQQVQNPYADCDNNLYSWGYYEAILSVKIKSNLNQISDP